MASQMAILTRTTKTLTKALYPQIKSISSFAHLSQEAHLATDHPPSDHPNPNSNSTPFPPNPASGSPLYNDTNWRNPIPIYQNPNSPMIPLGPFHNQTSRIQSMPPNMDLNSLSNMLADWTTSQRWEDIKGYFEAWIKSLDRNGKPNKPDVSLYNHYLRANLMMKASAGYLLDLVAQMEDFNLSPNTVSFNFVLKAMYEGLETEAAEKLLQRMEHTGKESQPDEESYDLVVTMLLNKGNIDAFDTALKYIDKILKGDYVLSMKVFDACVRSCCNFGRLDVLLSIIEKCKKMDQNKALCPNWNLCNHIAEIALKEDNSKLLFCALEFMARWIARGEKARPIVLLSVDEGLIVAALGTAGRTYNSTLLDASWAILRRSLRQKKPPNPESYIGKIYAHASLGSLQKLHVHASMAITTVTLSSLSLHSTTTPRLSFLKPTSKLHPLSLSISPKSSFLSPLSYHPKIITIITKANSSDIDTSFFDNLNPEEEFVYDPPTPPEDYIPPPSFDEGPIETEEEIAAAYEELYGPAYSGVSVLGKDIYVMDSKVKKTSGWGSRVKKEKIKDGFDERVVQVRRVTKVVKGGKQLHFRAVVIVGDKQGRVGVGVGKAKEVIVAVQKSALNARRNIITVPMTKYLTFPHRSEGDFGAAKVMLRPASPGTGVIAGGAVRIVLEMAGVENALGKQLRSKNALNNARATVVAVQKMRQFSEVARERGIPMEELWK